MSELVVETEQGKVRGQKSITENGFSYFTFRGIPYAKPPIGELRFAVTQPPEPWEGIRDATKTCNICAQFCKVTKTVKGSEDCLYLNVYTPKLSSTDVELLPVLVIIHGGGFMFGNGTDDSLYGPDFLIEREFVIVSINYRLSILGFLSLNRKEAPGNMGLMDQVQSLKWVQKNIVNFGGNPNNVTILGNSAGGASVGYLMLSPMAKGLFHKAISQSGSPLQHWAFNTDVKKLAFKIPSLQNITISDDDQLLEYLKSLTTTELINTSVMALCANEFKGGLHFGFVPTVEKPGDWEPFLSEPPYQLLAKGEFIKVPFMAGFCTREGLLMISHVAPTLDRFLKSKTFTDYFPFDLDSTEQKDLETTLKTNYMESDQLFNDEDAYAIDFFTDVDFFGGTYVFTKLIAKHNKSVYFYEFSYDGKLNIVKMNYNIKREGACHGDDAGYILKCHELTDPITETDGIVRDTMTAWISNFAKHGNPTPKLDSLLTTKWEPIAEDGVVCLVVDKTIKMKYEVYPKRMMLFEEFYKKKCNANQNHYKNPRTVNS